MKLSDFQVYQRVMLDNYGYKIDEKEYEHRLKEQMIYKLSHFFAEHKTTIEDTGYGKRMSIEGYYFSKDEFKQFMKEAELKWRDFWNIK